MSLSPCPQFCLELSDGDDIFINDDDLQDAVMQLEMLMPENHESPQVYSLEPTSSQTAATTSTMPMPMPQDPSIVPPEFDKQFINMTESDIHEFIECQQNKNTLKKHQGILQ